MITTINKKKIKVSKNRKKSWRKHTNISEFEEFLDEKRFEERIGHSISEAQNDDLFVIEKTGDDLLYQQKLDRLESKYSEKRDESKLRKIITGHRLYQKLESTSKVPAVNIQRKNSDKRKTIYNNDDKLKKYWNDRKESIQRAKLEKETKQKIKQDPKLRFDNNYDLWDDENVFCNKNVKVPVHLRQKPSLLPAVEVPLPGQSYNPSDEDYKSLMMSEVEKEIEKINEEKRLENKVDKYFLTKEEARNIENNWLSEMSQGLFDNDVEVLEEASNGETFSIPKKIMKKTKSQKRREMKEKLEKRERLLAKQIKIKENDVYRIKSIEREIKDREKRIIERAKARQARHIEALYKPKRLSRYRFQEINTEYNLPNEISGSLRSMKTEGNILEDRFKSFQKRNIIETRVLQFPKRKYKIRKEVKRRFKENIE